MEALTASRLADLAGVTRAEVDRLVELGILVAREGEVPFRTSDVHKVRLAEACERAGLPMDGIASTIRTGRLSFAFMEASPYQRWAVPSARTYRQVSQDTGVPLDTLQEALQSMGFARAAAELAASLRVLVDRSSRAHGGVAVKWLGDGVMFHFPEPAGAVLAALQMVRQVPESGLPAAHVGVAAGPVVVQGGDYYGRTVNLAARIAARAGAGQVLVSEPVARKAAGGGVTFVELGELALKGFSAPVRVLEALSRRPA
jgi:Adenylate and Guanylate cyclase catalytic domain